MPPEGKEDAPWWEDPGSHLTKEARDAWGPVPAYRNILKYVTYSSNVASDCVRTTTVDAGSACRLPCIMSGAPDALHALS